MAQAVKLLLAFVFGQFALGYVETQGKYACHCYGGCYQHNIKTYRCQPCADGFYGPFCQKENVALHKPTNQSANVTWYETSSNLAVDGDITTLFGDFRYQYKCTHALGTTNTEWTVNLKKSYQLHNIKIYNRKNHRDRLKGFSIYVDNVPCYTWEKHYDPGEVFSVICNAVGQVVRFQLPGHVILSLCEVQIFVCSDYWYGLDCDKTCNCRDQNEVCNKITGQCTSCPDGWTGRACDIPCVQGQYGTNCHKTCGHCLNGNSECDTVSGRCSAGCRAGWSSNTCDTGCVNGSYGINCNKTCGHCLYGNSACNTVSGLCKWGCLAGWSGNTCDTGCPHGYYGSNCRSTCGNCLNGNTCNTGNGQCSGGCDAGWHGTLCKIECTAGHYGTNCNYTCGQCLNGSESCDIKSGHCSDGCSAGRFGNTCKAECIPGHYGTNCNYTCGQCLNRSQPCDIKSGHCSDGCSVGWSGSTCKIGCSRGFYDINCKKQCGHCLSGNTTCDAKIGLCPDGCAGGWSGHICNTECETGNFGENCNQSCNNCNGKHCDRSTGSCLQGCISGYAEPNNGCTEKVTSNGGSSTMAAVGGTLAVVCVALVAVVIVVIIRRRRQRKPEHIYEDVVDLKDVTDARIKDEEKAVSEEVVKPSVQSTTRKGNDNVYTNLNQSLIPVDNLHSFIKSKTEKDFKEEYETLPSGLQASHGIGKKPCNKIKNRFLAIYPYDHSRVKLEMTSAEGSSDYINANYIDGYKKKNAYIATQGPVPPTTGDFWRMIWEQDVSTIVMLANLIEAGKKKCEQYWPELKAVKVAGKIKIKCRKVHQRADYTIREFGVKPDQVDNLRTVYMFHFTTWPDHGVPSAPALLSFWKQVKSFTPETNGPTTVHCSAGIGRTGTFIGLDSLVDEARDTKQVNVFECVRKMRENRINMVQTAEQYQFLHEILLEAITCYETLYTVTSFKEEFIQKKLPLNVEMVRLQKEFKDLTSLKKPVSQADIDIAQLPQNKLKNRNETIVPVSSGRVFLTTPVEGTNDYINAVTLPSCKNKDGFLVTQMPLESTVIDFWRMVYDKECLTIVSLTSVDTLASSQDLGIYWPEYGESMTVGPFTVENQTTAPSTSDITELSLVLKTQGTYENEVRNIQFFMLNDWPLDDRLPSDKYNLLMFLDKLERRREDIGDVPVVVQCIDGAKHSGPFCVLSNIISKLKLDQDVDIFVTVRELQCIRPQIVDSFKQYQYCYEVVKEYMRSLEIYGNL